VSTLHWSGHRELFAGGRYVRVVNYHNTPASGRAALHQELARFGATFVSIDLAELDRFFATGRWSSNDPGFLPVFYEGYRNGYDVAAPVCQELGISGWFAVCTGFVDCPVTEQELFARSHWIGLAEEEQDGRRLALSWEEVAELSRRHVVFPHTASHDGIADVVTDDDLYREILEPKRKMDAVTGQSAAAFSWLFGSPWGSSPRHDRALVDAGYRYLFSNTMISRIGD
jgi:hypothetical protein